LATCSIRAYHHEAQGIAPGAATETVVELLVRIDAERGCLLVVERTAGSVVLAGFFQFDAPVYHLDDIDAIQQVIQESLGYPSGHGWDSILGVCSAHPL
jgi:hypothetical protein